MFELPEGNPEKSEAEMSERMQVIRDAMERALRSECPAWKNAAIAAILSTADLHSSFTADDIWIQGKAQGHDLIAESQCGRPGSSMGTLLQRLKGAGLIETTGDFRYSERLKAHGKPLPVWRKAAV